MQTFLIILFALFVVYYYFVLWFTKRMETDNKLIFKFGKMGTGKTSDIVICGQRDLKNGWKHVYSTVKIPNFHYFDASKIAIAPTLYSFAPYSSIYIDEASLIFHARDFKNFPKELREWLAMIRQLHLKVTIYSQSPNIDKAIRDLCHEYHILKRFGVFLIDFLVTKKIDIGSDADGNGNLVDAYAKVGIFGGIQIHYLPRVIGVFNSFNPPQYNIITSQFIVKNDAYIRSESFKNFVPWHLKNVYRYYASRVRSSWSCVVSCFVTLRERAVAFLRTACKRSETSKRASARNDRTL